MQRNFIVEMLFTCFGYTMFAGRAFDPSEWYLYGLLPDFGS